MQDAIAAFREYQKYPALRECTARIEADVFGLRRFAEKASLNANDGVRRHEELSLSVAIVSIQLPESALVDDCADEHIVRTEKGIL